LQIIFPLTNHTASKVPPTRSKRSSQATGWSLATQTFAPHQPLGVERFLITPMAFLSQFNGLAPDQAPLSHCTRPTQMVSMVSVSRIHTTRVQVLGSPIRTATDTLPLSELIFTSHHAGTPRKVSPTTRPTWHGPPRATALLVTCMFLISSTKSIGIHRSSPVAGLQAKAPSLLSSPMVIRLGMVFTGTSSLVGMKPLSSK